MLFDHLDLTVNRAVGFAAHGTWRDYGHTRRHRNRDGTRNQFDDISWHTGGFAGNQMTLGYAAVDRAIDEIVELRGKIAKLEAEIELWKLREASLLRAIERIHSIAGRPWDVPED